MKLDLQFFASSKGNTSQQSGGSSSTKSSSNGGSSSSSSGSSNTKTYTKSTTEGESHSKGGAHSEASGKSWASGTVEDNTQAHRDAYNTDYSAGAKVSQTYDRLQQALDNRPGFQSSYEDKLNSLYDSIMNRDKFNYNFNADPMYQMYKDQYTAQGKQAMQDTMGQASALTGGYGSSYGQSVGQQAYQGYLQQLNNMIPTLRDQAYEQYRDEGNELLQKYNITGDAYNREYGQYRDQVADWQSDRAFNQAAYQDERNFDYNQFANERGYWNQEYWNEKNAEQSNQQVADENNWNDTYYRSQTISESNSKTKYNSDTNSSNWNTGQSDTTQSGWANSQTMNQTTPSGGSGKTKSSGASSQLSSVFDTAATGSGIRAVQENPGSSLNVSPYNISNNSYVAQASTDELNDMVSALKTADNATSKALLKYQMKQQGLSDAEIEFLEEVASGNRSLRGNRQFVNM